MTRSSAHRNNRPVADCRTSPRIDRYSPTPRRRPEPLLPRGVVMTRESGHYAIGAIAVAQKWNRWSRSALISARTWISQTLQIKMFAACRAGTTPDLRLHGAYETCGHLQPGRKLFDLPGGAGGTRTLNLGTMRLSE